MSSVTKDMLLAACKAENAHYARNLPQGTSIRTTPFPVLKSIIEAALSAAWSPIETAKREDGKLVLLWIEGYSTPVVGEWLHKSAGWVTPDDYSVRGTPTHWMPLPDPPKP